MPHVVGSDREVTSDRLRLLAMAARVANVGLACGSALALLVFVNFFYWYSVTGQRQFSSPFYLVLYYVLPLTVAAGLFAALRLQPVHKINLLMVLVASCTAIYAMELFLKWRASSLYGQALPVMTILEDSSDAQGDAAALEREWGVPVDPRNAGEFLDALRGTYPDSVPIITFSKPFQSLNFADTADLLTEISRGVDKWLWFVEAHVQADR